MPTGPAAREVRAIACAPRAIKAAPAPLARVAGSDDHNVTMFAEGRGILLDRIGAEGLEVGKTYFVRRVLSPDEHGTAKAPDPWLNLHTAGWIKVDSIEGTHARATVLYSCDSIDVDDAIDSFEVPVVPAPVEDKGKPDYQSPGKVLFGILRTSVSGEGSLVAIDRGADDGMETGQRVTFVRRGEGIDQPIHVLGEGLVVLVGPGSATVRVERADQPIYVGDLVALHR
jgi:hypothetical protein